MLQMRTLPFIFQAKSLQNFISIYQFTQISSFTCYYYNTSANRLPLIQAKACYGSGLRCYASLFMSVMARIGFEMLVPPATRGLTVCQADHSHFRPGLSFVSCPSWSWVIPAQTRHASEPSDFPGFACSARLPLAVLGTSRLLAL